MKSFIYKFYTILVPIAFAQSPGEGTCGGGEGLTNPLNVCSIPDLVKSIAKLATEIGIPIAAIFIIYAGIKFVTARGNEEQLKEARKTFYWAIIGAGILLGAWVIAEAIVGTIEGLE